jgi:subtilisin family serine protease
MIRALLAGVILCVSGSAGLADERVLLFPDDLTGTRASTLDAEPAAAPNRFQELRRAAAERGTVKVIVGTRVPFAAEGNLEAAETAEQRAEITAAAQAIRGRFADAIRRAPEAFRIYDSVPFVALEVTAEELDRLAADPDVITIRENKKGRFLLAESVPMIQGHRAHAAGFSGKGQTVAVVDTGVDKTHLFFGNRVVSEACYSLGGWCPGGTTSSTASGSAMPCTAGLSCNHGTHVAGIAAGRGSAFSGVARDASIIAIQVASPDEEDPEFISPYFSDVVRALERVYDLRGSFSVAAVNLSLGGEHFSSNCDSADLAMTAAVRNLKSAGIATIAASGNGYESNSLSFPACISDVVSVGAVSDVNAPGCSDDGTPLARGGVTCHSNSASFLSLLAPGSVVTSAISGNEYDAKEGTSMAVPHVAGAWAVLKQKANNASVDTLLAVLQNTGKPVTDARNGVTKKRIDIKAALDQVTAGTQTLPT